MNHRLPDRLLAKSYPQALPTPPGWALLEQHSRDVALACQSLMHLVGPDMLRAAELPSDQLERLSKVLRLNGWLQDIGKSNSDFQRMVRSEPRIQQLIRHEALSALLIWTYSPLRDWLQPALNDDLVPALWGAAGHHRKFDDGTTPTLGSPTEVYLAHADFTTILNDLAADLKLQPPPKLHQNIHVSDSSNASGTLNLRQALRRMKDDFREIEESFTSLPARTEIALIKGLGIAADVAASAIARHDARYSLSSFIEETLRIGISTADLRHVIHRWAWAHIADGKPAPNDDTPPPNFKVRPFQMAIAASDSFLTLAEAGCGSGKSLAAYLWAEQWLQRRSNQGVNSTRLFYCLPTTGTSTEHFKDYALESGVPACLSHSRSAIDLLTIAQTAAQEEGTASGEDSNRKAIEAEHAKLEALSLWGVPFVVGTADTVLGLMSNGLRSTCALPAIVQSCIVFDEIHAFDEQLFGHLLVFLRIFPKLPVLLMTASLTQARKNALTAARPDLTCIPGPAELETLPRYSIHFGSRDLAWNAADTCLNEGGKVLWVCNRVAWANDIYSQARTKWPMVAANVYHSRLRYKDRSLRHRNVVDQFKKENAKATLLISTQVAEMSLDLSADLLISDLAPIPSLIQRLGRLNRRAKPEMPSQPKAAFICSVGQGDAKPYGQTELERAMVWIRSLQHLKRPLCQRDLAEHLGLCETEEAFDLNKAEERACFIGVAGINGLWRTRPGMTRAEGYTVSIILENDLKHFRRISGKQEPDLDWLRQHEVSIPIQNEIFGWERMKGRFVAPANQIFYDYDETTHEGTGARWQTS